MPVLTQPDIKVDDIKIQFDSESQDAVDKIINNWGSAIPLVKIGDYVLKIGEVLSCSIKVNFNQIPTFDISVDDNTFKIRTALKNEIDKCVIFFGFKDWYVKFNGIITNIQSDSGPTVYVSGIFYQKELHDSEQKLYKEKNVSDILKEICTDCKLGLFTYENTTLQESVDVVINPNRNRIDFIKEIISRYTDNIFSVDTFGFLHIGDIETILKQEIDKYSISWKDGTPIDETPIIFRNTRFNTEFEDDEDKKIPIDSYTIDTNFSLSQLITNKTYKVFGGTEQRDIKSYEHYGNGNNTENTFDDFLKHKNPHYNARINKLLCGNLIKITLRNVLYEIVPFTICGLELWTQRNVDDEKEEQIDEEHSGKHMIIGYSYDYEKTDSDEQNHITQTLLMI